MTLLRVVPTYGAILAILFIALSARVILARRGGSVALGTGDDAGLLRRARVHANFAEYVPFALLLLTIADIDRANVVILHILCVCLVVGRAMHAWGVSHTPEDYRFRVTGIATTLTVIGVTAVVLVAG